MVALERVNRVLASEMLSLSMFVFVWVELGLTQISIDDVAIALHAVHPE